MTAKKHTWRDIWILISIGILLLYLLFLIYPMFSLLQQSVMGPEGFTFEYFQKFFSKSYYFNTLWNSFKVSVCATAITLVLGVPLAYFYNMYEIRGKTFLQLIIILCSMSAPFIGAYAWILLCGNNGLVTNLCRELLHIQIPSIYGFGGILLVLSLQLFPLVFLYVSGAMKNIDNSLLEAAENMNCTGARRFFRIVVPLCMPTILAAALLVFMRAFADFGTPLLIGQGYRTFPVEIYNAFFSETGGNYGFACATSVIAILITTVIFLIQKWSSNQFSFTMNALHPIERKKAKGIFNVLIHLYSYLVVAVAFLPQIYIFYESFRKTSGKAFVPGYSLDSYQSAFKVAGNAIKNTFVIGLSALVIIILLAILIAYLVTRRRNALNSTIDVMSMLPYVIPGSVVGIALIMAFNKKPLILTGTMIIMIIALVIRRLPYTIRSSAATLQQIPITVEEAAISLGCSKMKAFFKITIPMMANGIVSGAILSWVTIITELSTAICLYTVRTQTLTLAIYTYVLRGNDGIAAALATILSFTTIVSLLIFMKVSKNKEITF
ncbi:ABC transporter permease [Faecalibaculum rodentium]|uniref:Iron ABC transporter permease n=1 Tax=Faecalibaculum rodentium TaxID=1702221 RepID=A0A1Q9YJV2_9FIRM|nr:iron ABC transporter permease [Faecalibaculum rodentium]OLU44807.1 iron ABC transporter permease [Faecalibaculum rodentium]